MKFFNGAHVKLAVSAAFLVMSGCTEPTSEVCGRDKGLGGSVPSSDCEMAQAEDDGLSVGIELCDDGSLNRFASPGCPLCYDVNVCSGTDDACGACADGETCVEGTDGCQCITVCTSDIDCAAGEACLCPGDGGAQFGTRDYPVCVQSECRENADCGDGGLCGVGAEGCGGVRGFFCRDLDDECKTSDDCSAEGLNLCFFDMTDQSFQCMTFADC
jgi:hypothetical protein